MTEDPMELLTETVPALLDGALEDLRAAAEGGDPGAAQRLKEALDLELVVHVALEGEGGGSVYLVTRGGQTTAQQARPEVEAKLAIALPYEAAQIALEELGEQLERGLAKARRRLSRLSAARGLAALPDEPLRFHSVIKDTPDFDEVRTKITLGAGDIAEDPVFTLVMDYATFEDLRARKIKPQALMGRMQIEGDAARAMQVGMEMAQRMGARA